MRRVQVVVQAAGHLCVRPSVLAVQQPQNGVFMQETSRSDRRSQLQLLLNGFIAGRCGVEGAAATAAAVMGK
jgi:hypothetical protein